MAKTPKAKLAIAFDNETFDIQVQPTAPDNGADGFTFVVQFGMTQPDDNKKPTRRFRVFRNDIDLGKPVATAKAAVLMAISTQPDDMKDDALYDVDGAIAQIKEALGDEPKAKETAWDDLSNAAELEETREHANAAAKQWEEGEENARSGLYNLSQDVAAVADKLTPKQFDAWAESGPDSLRRALNTGRNAKSEFIFVGKLPRDFFDMCPDSTTKPKSFQLQYNNAKNDLATAIAGDAWKDQKGGKLPTANKVQKMLKEHLAGAIGEGDVATAKEALYLAMYTHIAEHTEDFSLVAFAVEDDAIVPALSGLGSRKYLVPTQFGTGDRVHELVLAVCKEIKANAPDAIEAQEEASEDRAAGEAVRPKTFAEYGVNTAAMHLARILSAHPDAMDVFDAMSGLADIAEKEGWDAALSQAAVDAEAENSAEDEGDDEA